MKSLYRLLVFSILVLLVGCDFSEDDEFDDNDETRFENASSVAITISPAGDEDFNVFVLQPDTRRFVRRVGDEMTYTFIPDDEVQVVENGNLVVTFTDL